MLYGPYDMEQNVLLILENSSRNFSEISVFWGVTNRFLEKSSILFEISIFIFGCAFKKSVFVTPRNSLIRIFRLHVLDEFSINRSSTFPRNSPRRIKRTVHWMVKVSYKTFWVWARFYLHRTLMTIPALK